MGVESFKGGRTVKKEGQFLYSEEEAAKDAQQLETEARKEEPKICEFLDVSLDEIDFEALYSVFKTYLVRSGVNPNALNKVPRENFFLHLVGEENLNAHYTAAWNHVVLGVEALRHLRKWIDDGSPAEIEYIKLRIGETIVHELVHASSKIEVEWKEEKINGKTDWTTESCVGYRGKSNEFVAINEGITERIAHEIFMEYVQMKGLNRNVSENIMQFQADARAINKYSVYMGFVEEITQRIDESVGLQSGTTWGALKRGAFEGSQLQDELVQELFSETFGENFLDTLETMPEDATPFQLGEFGGAYKLDAISPNVANRWLDALGVKKKIKNE